jgi:integrase
MLLAFLQHAEQRYRDLDGLPTDELENLRDALRPLKQLYAALPAAEFSPLKLKAVRQKLTDSRRYRVRFKEKADKEDKTLERGFWEHDFRKTPTGCEVRWKKKWRPGELIDSKKALSRSVINQRIRRIVRVFRWAASEEIVPEGIHRALAAVPGLQQGRNESPESDGVKPVAVEIVEATLPKMPAPVAAMAQLQLATGMRASEVMVMRAMDLSTSGPVWTYTPHKHKNQYRGMDRIICLGPKAQETIKPFLRPNVEAYAAAVDDHWLMRQRAFVAGAQALEVARADLFATVALGADVVNSIHQVHEVLEDGRRWPVGSVYLVCEHPNGDYLVDDAIWVANVLELTAGFRLQGKRVILGYCNHQMLAVASAAANSIASGTWMNVRSFPPAKFRTAYEDEIKRKTTWYYCPQAFSEYKIPTLDIAIPRTIDDTVRCK